MDCKLQLLLLLPHFRLVVSVLPGGAGALGAYLWKNRGMQRNADQVVIIAGAALLAIAWGARSDTFVDNVGELHCPALNASCF